MKKYQVIAFLLPFLVSSCMVFNSGSVSSGPLLNATDRYVDQARGEARSCLFLGIGSTYNRKLIYEAKLDLHRRRPLENGEYYSNFTTEVAKKTFLGIIYIIEVEVNADVLKGLDSSSAPFTEQYKRQTGISYAAKRTGSGRFKRGLAANDNVYYSYDRKNYKLYKVSAVDKENVMLMPADPADKNLLAPLDSEFFVTGVEVGGIKAGDQVTVEVPGNQQTVAYEDGVVSGTFGDKCLVKTMDGFFVLPAVKVKKR